MLSAIRIIITAVVNGVETVCDVREWRLTYCGNIPKAAQDYILGNKLRGIRIEFV